MTKADLVDQVAATVQLPKPKAEAVITGFLQGIMDALHAGDTVELRGFGSFRLRHRQARTGRNPRTGNPLQIPAKAIPSFTAGKAFHETVQTRPASSDGANGVVAHRHTGNDMGFSRHVSC
jgi:nucleoid DNA-binding protein